MSAIVWTVVDANTGAPINLAEATGTIEYDGTFGFGATTKNFTSYAAGNGQIAADIDYLGSSGQVTSELKAAGYLPQQDDFPHGVITGNIQRNVRLQPVSTPLPSQAPDTGTAADVATFFKNLQNQLGTLGTNATIILVVVLIVIAVIVLGVALAEGETKAP